MSTRVSLPIDVVIPEIESALKHHSVVLLEAPPGAGKTTRVPIALLQQFEHRILVLEPRRLAARRSAERVAEELNEKVGDSCGYRIRLEKKEGPRTRLSFYTEGLFLRTFLSNPKLDGIDCVVIDEFHERNIHTDVAIGICKTLMDSTRPDLKLLVMSATLSTEGLVELFPKAAKVQSEGRTYPVDVQYLEADPNSKSARSLELHVEDGILKALEHPQCTGHVLVFLSGAQEILRCQSHLKDSPYLAKKGKFEVLELRSETPKDLQDKVFQPSPHRKIILSTNVAETSLTIDGVTAVVDAGHAKISGHNAWTGFDTLELRKISQASAIQRAGRAGRTAPGVAIRLYSKHDFHSRPNFEKPEVHRVELSQTLLELSAALQWRNFPWVTLPLSASIDLACSLLKTLEAFDEGLNCTNMGKAMAKLPLNPRLARILIEAQKEDCLQELALSMALLSEGSPASQRENHKYGHSDLYDQARRVGASGSSDREFSAFQVNKIRSSADQYLRVFQSGSDLNKSALDFESEKKLKSMDRCLLIGFSDRLAKAKTGAKSASGSQLSSSFGSNNSNHRLREFVFATGGGQAMLSQSSIAQTAEYLLALDAEEVRQPSGQTHVKINLASEMPPAILLEKDHLLLKNDVTTWEKDRAKSFSRVQLGNIVLLERPIKLPEQEELLLSNQIRALWPMPFGTEQISDYESLLQRALLISKAGTAIRVPFVPLHPDDAMSKEQAEEFDFFLMHACENKRSFEEVTKQELVDWVLELMTDADRNCLQKNCPDKIVVGAGRKVKVKYLSDGPPRVSSRIQDFFGTLRTPTVLNGKLSLVVELLSPNGQAVQVTQDLSGFWKNGYPQARKELMRRYPRHFWPENPEEAEPPPPKPPRR